ncbi:glucose-6-phosphate isomerase [Solimicrobium silvestre]|uniref:Glucose-6-phosphate isomerase n=1 Tax=Solimicrobium silvestre TaxID=2099400 RepID=A0A2S9H2M5_9BURK|nr:glucose-6-phosphate isomerase [Solimicrobium silvestre]PRC94193.1 Glucose-6-phosphate isomerase [Solimicrobium silvestre]
MSFTPLSDTPAYKQLQLHQQQMHQQGLEISHLFDQQSDRFTQFSLSAAGVFLDYSKNRITETTKELLCDFARQQQVELQRDAMFSGEKINFTEQRAVLHTALRAPSNTPQRIDGIDINAEVHMVLAQMQAFVEKVHSGVWRGASGLVITDVVNIGIGGSDLGPKMVCQALRSFAHQGIQSHFVSNLDGHALDAVLSQVNPASTLFIISSKTFTTADTMLNAHSARAWFLQHFSAADLSRHFVAVSSNQPAVQAFGIAPENRFGFWDWVGGRYSLWSAIGLPIALSLGFAHFRALLDGAHAMDVHFQQAPIEQNMPILLAMLGIWNRDLLGCGSLSIAAYHHDLRAFPNYLQQLDMESNGKRINHHGQTVDVATGPIIWGDVGTNGQHAYFQHLHQSSDITPVDFIAALRPQHHLAEHQLMLLANCFAQSQALMRGKTAQQVTTEMQTQGMSDEQISLLLPHRIFAGNRPSNTILLDELSPMRLGALIALYEHKVAVQGFFWGINSFDQWGVELGKVLAKAIEGDLHSGTTATSHDSSTAGLIAKVRAAGK